MLPQILFDQQLINFHGQLLSAVIDKTIGEPALIQFKQAFQHGNKRHKQGKRNQSRRRAVGFHHNVDNINNHRKAENIHNRAEHAQNAVDLPVPPFLFFQYSRQISEHLSHLSLLQILSSRNHGLKKTHNQNHPASVF